jgi:hypothetical protein
MRSELGTEADTDTDADADPDATSAWDSAQQETGIGQLFFTQQMDVVPYVAGYPVTLESASFGLARGLGAQHVAPHRGG